jgi:multiple sugar transport system substrate-binding protein
MMIDDMWAIGIRMNHTDAAGNYTHLGWLPWDRGFGQGQFMSWATIFRGQLADVNAGRITTTHPNNVRMLQWIYDRARELDPEKVTPFVSAFSPPNNPPANHPFITGRVAMVIHGDWFIRHMELHAPDIEYGVTYYPIVNPGDGPISWGGGWSMTIPTGARRLEAAADFIVFITGREGNRIYSQQRNRMHTYLPLIAEHNPYATEHFRFMESLTPYTIFRPVLPIAALHWDRLAWGLERAFLNVDTPINIARTIETEMQAELNRFLPLR